MCDVTLANQRTRMQILTNERPHRDHLTHEISGHRTLTSKTLWLPHRKRWEKLSRVVKKFDILLSQKQHLGVKSLLILSSASLPSIIFPSPTPGSRSQSPRRSCDQFQFVSRLCDEWLAEIICGSRHHQLCQPLIGQFRSRDLKKGLWLVTFTLNKASYWSHQGDQFTASSLYTQVSPK